MYGLRFNRALWARQLATLARRSEIIRLPRLTVMTTSQPSADQIIGALEGSGFLFEQEIATVLEANGFHVETSWPYLDEETKKSRELDLRAVKNVAHIEDQKLQVFVELLVECKDSETPFVFLERQKNKREQQQQRPKAYVFPKKNYQVPTGSNAYREVRAFEHLGLGGSHYYFKEQNKATQFSKIVRKGSNWVANHEGIYDSLFLPVAKALEARIKALPKPTQTGDWRTVWLFFPIVALRDHLMAMSVSGHEKSLQNRGRITFVRNLDSDLLKGEYLVDFVTSTHLQSYLENDVGSFAEAVAGLAHASPLLLRGDSA